MFTFILDFTFYKTTDTRDFNMQISYITTQSTLVLSSVLCRIYLLNISLLLCEIIGVSQMKFLLLYWNRGWRLSFVSPNSLLGRESGIFCLFISDHTMSTKLLRKFLLLSE
jgi:hypothetical protein